MRQDATTSARHRLGTPRRPVARLAATAALLALAVAGACSGMGGIFGVQEPTATYRDFSVQSLTLEDIGFDLQFDLGNPNAFDLPVARLDWNLDLFDEAFTFGQIRFEEPDGTAGDTTTDGGVLTFLGVQSIPAQGSLMLDAPFLVAIPQTFEGLVRIVMGEDVPFNIAGTLYFDSRFGTLSVPFSQSGVFPNSEVIHFLEGLGSDVLGGLLR